MSPRVHKGLVWLCGPCYTRISLRYGSAGNIPNASWTKRDFQPRKASLAGLRVCSSSAEHSATHSDSVKVMGDARPLVVLVHGFLGHRVQFLPLATSLSRQDFDVFNFGYASRTETLQEHARSLVDAVSHRLQRKGSGPPNAVHYVTHSFGGVVLRAAMRTGMLPLNDTRIAFVAPPIRGCILARTVYEADLGDSWRTLSPYVRYAAETVLGTASGQQLMKHPAKWFFNEQDHAPFPGSALVITGNVGRRLNPLIPEDNDGVVAVSTFHMQIEIEKPNHWCSLAILCNMTTYASPFYVFAVDCSTVRICRRDRFAFSALPGRGKHESQCSIIHTARNSKDRSFSKEGEGRPLDDVESGLN
jgi:pimeloyl-ACP methyl ester carboxylesterase